MFVKFTYIFLKGLFRNIQLIFNNNSKNKIGLLLSYLKIKIKYFFLIKILGLKINKERICGFNVKHLNYKLLIFLFEEIFIKEIYFFKAKTDAPLIIDCGSSIGMSVIFFKKMYSGSRIFAFEPDAETFKALEENIRVNNLKNIELFNKAVYNRKGKIDFYCDASMPGSLVMSTRKNKSIKKLFVKKTNAVLLSDYIDKEIDFLKIDIEGAEGLVIDEMENRDRFKFIKKMVIECHFLDIENSAFLKIIKILKKNTFNFWVKKNEINSNILIYAQSE